MTARKSLRRPETLPEAVGQQLMLCRVCAGYSTQVDFAKAIGMSATPIAHVERGARVPSPSLFESWMETCGVTGQLARAIETMYRLARMTDDPQAYQAAPWEEIEEEARTLMYWELTLIPGILQTEDYARSLFTAWRNAPEKINELTARRTKRQTILTRSDAPDVVFVIWQRALYTLADSPEIMAAQLSLVLELSQLPNIYIHVLPSGVRAGMGMAGPVSIASTATGDAALMEGPSETVVMTEQSQIKLAQTIFNSVRGSAKDDADSRVMITEAMETWKTATSTGGSPATVAPLRETASS